MPPNTYLRTLICNCEVPVRKIHCISLHIPDYIIDIPIYSKQLNSHTSSYFQRLTGCLVFPVLQDMIITCIKAPVCYWGPTTSATFILFDQHVRKDRVNAGAKPSKCTSSSLCPEFVLDVLCFYLCQFEFIFND